MKYVLEPFGSIGPVAVLLLFLTSSMISDASGTLSPTAADVVHHYLQAVGGYSRLKAIQTLRTRGVYTEGSFVAHTVMERKRPNFRFVNVGGYCEGFDGSAWEHNTHSNKITRTSGAAAAASRRGSEFDESFVDALTKHTRIEIAGQRTIGAKRIWLLVVVLADGWRKDYYMDEQTGLIAGLKVSMPLHARGKPVASMSLYDDYRRVDGVLFPFRQVERNLENGTIMNVLQWNSIEMNPRIDMADFHPPCHPKD